jgi:hypothetical protein
MKKEKKEMFWAVFSIITSVLAVAIILKMSMVIKEQSQLLRENSQSIEVLERVRNEYLIEFLEWYLETNEAFDASMAAGNKQKAAQIVNNFYQLQCTDIENRNEYPLIAFMCKRLEHKLEPNKLPN